jgi:hypothetical protein
MVLSNGSKHARHQASIINRPTCGGTAKKGGIASLVGHPYWFGQRHISSRVQTTVRDQVCMPVKTTTVQQTGYRATHTGRMG